MPPPLDDHDDIFLDEGHHIAPVQTFVELRTPGEGPRGHEAPHHATIFELVTDGVCMVWAGFLEGSLELVLGQHCLTLVTACGGRDAPHAKATCLPVVAIIMVDRGSGR
jgi:hypothetical protein